MLMLVNMEKNEERIVKVLIPMGEGLNRRLKHLALERGLPLRGLIVETMEQLLRWELGNRGKGDGEGEIGK